MKLLSRILPVEWQIIGMAKINLANSNAWKQKRDGNMKIFIAGGDGYLGWPTAMNLSANGHEILVRIMISGGICHGRRCRIFIRSTQPHRARSRVWQKKPGRKLMYALVILLTGSLFPQYLRNSNRMPWSIMQSSLRLLIQC